MRKSGVGAEKAAVQGTSGQSSGSISDKIWPIGLISKARTGAAHEMDERHASARATWRQDDGAVLGLVSLGGLGGLHALAQAGSRRRRRRPRRCRPV